MVRYTHNISISEESLRRKNKVGGDMSFCGWQIVLKCSMEWPERVLLKGTFASRSKGWREVLCPQTEGKRVQRSLNVWLAKKEQAGRRRVWERAVAGDVGETLWVWGGTGHSGSWNWMSLGWMRGGRQAVGSLWLLCLMVCGANFFFLFS